MSKKAENMARLGLLLVMNGAKVVVPRSQLGQVVAALIAVITTEDPISEHYHIHPDPTWLLKRVAAEHGWTLAEVLRELDERGVSAKWQYFNGVGEIEHHTQQGAKKCGFIC